MKPRVQPADLLSPRQYEVLTLIAQGLTGPEVAARLHLTPETVKSHMKAIRGRLGAYTSAHAAAMWGLEDIEVRAGSRPRRTP